MKKSKRIISLTMAVLLSSISVNSALVANAESQIVSTLSPEEKITSSLSFKIDNLTTEKEDQKIPVYIWYKDIDFNEVDRLTEKQTGLTPADCEVITEFPSNELLYSIKNKEQNSKKQMKQYLERTKDSRNKERERTNTYKNTRKTIAREKYNEKSNSLKNQLSLNEKDIIFSSEYAPMIITEMTTEEITKASLNSDIEEIGYYQEYESVSFTATDTTTDDIGIEAKLSMGLSKVYEDFGLTGENVNVGLIEAFIPGSYPSEDFELNYSEITIVEAPDCPITPSITDSAPEHWHANNSLRVIAGSQSGIAKNVNIFATNCLLPNMEAILSCNLDVLEYNNSVFINEKTPSNGELVLNEQYAYSIYDRYFDHVISQHNISTVIAGGNYGSYENDVYDEDNSLLYHGSRITSPGLAYNAITVGGYSNNNTGTIEEDDFLKDYSWKNKYENLIGCEKPDVVMPSNYPGGGTSVASPALTAVIALMMELKPSLSLYPQSMKAITLASCHRKVTQSTAQGGQETMEQGITERQGAGAPDAWTMACIVSQGTYGTGVLNGLETNIDIVQPPYGAENMNISITWLKENYYENEHSSYYNVTEGQTNNIDLYVYQSNEIIDSSLLTKSSTEMCYVPVSSTDYKYQFKIKQLSNPTSVRYAYAWSTDNMVYSPVQQEGIYYIKNASTERFMLYNSSTATHISMKSITNRNNLTDTSNWIVDKVNNVYNIKSGYNYVEAYLSENTATGGVIADTNAYDINLIQNEDGSYYITNIAQNKILCYSSPSYVWSNYDSETDLSSLGYKWYLNKINYLKGDTNTDGILNVTDVTTLQAYLSGNPTANNKQVYLSDVNDNGIVDVSDVTSLQLYLSEIS